MLKLILSLLSLALKLINTIKSSRLRKRIRKEYQNEQIARQMAKLRRALAARRAQRRIDDNDPDRRMRNDGYRRD